MERKDKKTKQKLRYRDESQCGRGDKGFIKRKLLSSPFGELTSKQRSKHDQKSKPLKTRERADKAHIHTFSFFFLSPSHTQS